MAPRTTMFQPRRVLRFAAAAAVFSLSGLLLAPSPAEAASATVSVTGDVLTFTAAPGQANRLTISPQTGNRVLIDDAVAVTPGTGCTAVDATAVSCAGVWLLKIATGDSDDTIVKTSDRRADLDGGAGNDTIQAGPAVQDADDPRGNALIGGPGDDTLIGGPDADQLIGGPGADTMTGGAGHDYVDYTDHTAAITADADGAAGDDGIQAVTGVTAEGDTIAADVEGLVGGAGADTLIAGNVCYYLAGGAGNDTLKGSAAADILLGGEGNDTIYGAAGADDIYPGNGSNTAYGGDGNDYFALGYEATTTTVNTAFGGPGDDGFYSSPGTDRMIGNDGLDGVSYQNSAVGVTVDIDSQPGDDGGPTEHDTVYTDIETLVGSSYDDVLIGNDGPNTIAPGSGNDLVKGLGGADDLGESYDDDVMVGGDGDDILRGGPGADVLRGEAGNDTLYGGTGYDFTEGGDGTGDTCDVNGDGTTFNCELFGPIGLAPRTAARKAMAPRGLVPHLPGR